MNDFALYSRLLFEIRKMYPAGLLLRNWIERAEAHNEIGDAIGIIQKIIRAKEVVVTKPGQEPVFTAAYLAKNRTIAQRMVVAHLRQCEPAHQYISELATVLLWGEKKTSDLLDDLADARVLIKFNPSINTPISYALTERGGCWLEALLDNPLGARGGGGKRGPRWQAAITAAKAAAKAAAQAKAVA